MSLFPGFNRIYNTASAEDSETAFLLFRDGSALMRRGEEQLPRLSTADLAFLESALPLPLGVHDGVFYHAVELHAEAPDGWESLDLRSLHARIPDVEWAIAGYAAQILHWRRTSRFCPVCGAEMGELGPEWRRRCPRCNHERYPIVSPAVLALVHDGADRILLAHKPGWGARRSILAGFVLPGESLEECVHREVLEESGVRVADLVYYSSQPWPFPQQLMVGFNARYVSGEIVIDAEELEGADWYSADALPPLPPPFSLARKMIDAWRAAVTGEPSVP